MIRCAIEAIAILWHYKNQPALLINLGLGYE